MVRIASVETRSPAEKAGISPGDLLISLNGQKINDVLDYRFYLSEKKVTLSLSRDGKPYEVTIRKGEYDDVGLGFDTYLMDKKRSCANKCVFCFIDQLPKGMRESLYFKDDDSRLSFLMGNYITLTNLKPADVERIIRMKMSPINVSVHTTDPDLRVRMTGNRFAGRSLDYLKQLAEGGVRLNCQIVLCKGLNDGQALEKTMHDLGCLYPAVQSVSVVPAGLTRYREGLYPLSPFDREESRQIVRQVELFASGCRKVYGVSLFYLADEFYLSAGLPIPPEDSYDGYPQIENGVGMLRSFLDECREEIGRLDSYDLSIPRSLTVATGEAACPSIGEVCREISARSPALRVETVCIQNDFFGRTITVSGLMTGGDLLKQLKGRDLGERLLLPENCTESTHTMFLDGMTVGELSSNLSVRIELIGPDGHDFVAGILY